jgi:hypothetical protein
MHRSGFHRTESDSFSPRFKFDRFYGGGGGGMGGGFSPFSSPAQSPGWTGSSLGGNSWLSDAWKFFDTSMKNNADWASSYVGSPHHHHHTGTNPGAIPQAPVQGMAVAGGFRPSAAQLQSLEHMFPQGQGPGNMGMTAGDYLNTLGRGLAGAGNANLVGNVLSGK